MTARQPVAGPRLGAHIPALDGIRALAILMVLCIHFAGPDVDRGLRSGPFYERIYSVIMRAGASGVDLFFVLSGFLITRILLQTKGSPRAVANFYVRRVLRIFPLYYVALLLAFIVVPAVMGTPSPGQQAVGKYQWWLWAYLGNFASWLTGVNWDAGPLRLNHFWSLAVEEHFYLLWPLLVTVCSRRRLAQVAVGFIVLAVGLKLWFVAHGLDVAAYELTPCRLDGLAIGGLLAIASFSSDSLEILRPYARITFPVGGAVLVLLAFISDSADWLWWTPAFTHTIYPVFFAAMIVLVLCAPPGQVARRVLQSAPLRFLGKYSYGIYVWHAMLCPSFLWLLPVATFQRLTGSRIGGLLIFASLASALSILAALLSWFVLEKRFLRLKVAFEYRGLPTTKS